MVNEGKVMSNINFGDFIYQLYQIFVNFFTTLYNLLSLEFDIPNFVVTVINKILPNLTIPESVSVLGLLAVTGIPIAIAIGIYFIFKGPV